VTERKFKTVFFGTPDFSIPTLEMLAQNPEIDLIKVVTMPDRPAGRGQHLSPPPVAVCAKNRHISLCQTANINKEESLLAEFVQEKVDLFIVLAFAQFLSEKLLKIPAIGAFNIHTSLLPKYRGAAPIQYALLAGEQSTGVSIQKMVKEMDAGDLVYGHSVEISKEENSETLFNKLKIEAAKGCEKFITQLSSGEIIYTPQDHGLASYAPTIKKNDGYVDFVTCSRQKIERMLKAYYPWPGIFCFIAGQRLKIFDVTEEKMALSPGKIFLDFGTLLVGCSDGALRLREIQLEGKKISGDQELVVALKNKYQSSPEMIVLTPLKE